MISLATLANLIKHGDALLDLLHGANTMQTVDRLRQITHGDAGGQRLLGELLTALNGLEQNLRALKHTEIIPENVPAAERTAHVLGDAFGKPDPKRGMTTQDFASLTVLCMEAARISCPEVRTYYSALEEKCAARWEALRQGRVMP